RLARYAKARGEVAVAVRTALRAEDISRSFLRLLARTLPEEEALRFAAARGEPLGIAFAAADGLSPDLRSALWDSVTRPRGPIFEETAARRQALRAAADPKIQPLWERFVSARQRLMDHIVRGRPREGSPEEGRALLAQARADSEKAEEALVAASAVFG